MPVLFSSPFHASRRLIPVLLLAFLACSCNSMKRVPENESLLVRNKVKVSKGGTVSKSDVMNMLTQEPNSRILGARVKLTLYNWSKPDKKNWWNNKLREIGEEPVIFDSSAIASSYENILLHAAGNGYFHPQLTSRIKRKGKDSRKVVVAYNLMLDKPYHIRNIDIAVLDDSLQHYFRNWRQESMLDSGMQYKVSTLDAERTRIAEQLQNAGYWAFSKDFISYSIDSALNSKQMDVRLIVRKMPSRRTDSLSGNPVLLHHKKYYIDNIYIFPQSRSRISERMELDTVLFENLSRREKRKGLSAHVYHIVNQGKPIIKYKPVLQKIFLQNGNLYTLRQVTQSYDNLSDLRVFQYTNITLSEKPYDTTLSYNENNLLDCTIHMMQGSRFGFSVEGQLTTSSGIQGISATVGFQHRNTFGGGEIFNIKLKGLYEFQVTVDQQKNKTFLNTFEVKAEASLEFPRFLLPISIDRFSQRFRPSSIISVSYSYQHKRDYSRGIFNATFGYHWKQRFAEHTLNPVEVSTIQMLNTSESFQSLLNGYRESNNYRLLYQYSDHFILTPRYHFQYNDQRPNEIRDYNRLRIEIETAGNLLYGFARAAQGPKPTEESYRIANLPFSQYVRADFDYSHHFVFGAKTDLVFRAGFGIGYSYANSHSMPYEKSFFIGGNNTIRAWALYQLGPGSYLHPEGTADFERLGDIRLVFNLEQRFPIVGGLRGAVFLDAGNIWLCRANEAYPDGEFRFDRFYKELALGTGIGLRYDFKFFLLRVDMGIPVLDPAYLTSGRGWVIERLKWKHLIFNFGIGYPF